MIYFQLSHNILNIKYLKDTFYNPFYKLLTKQGRDLKKNNQ